MHSDAPHPRHLARIGLGLTAAALLIAAAVVVRRPHPWARADIPAAQPRSADERLGELDRELAKNPSSLPALAEKGIILYRKGPAFYIKAIGALEDARDKGALDARIFRCLGEMYAQTGLPDYAAREYVRYLNNFPDNREARLLLGKSYYSSAKYRKAADEFSKLLERGGGDIIALENLALSLYKSGDKTGAENIFSRMRGLGPQAARRAAFSQAGMAFEGGDYQSAAKALEELKNVSADATLSRPEVLRLYAKSLGKLGRNAESCDVWSELSALLPDDAEAKKEAARLHRRTGTNKGKSGGTSASRRHSND